MRVLRLAVASCLLAVAAPAVTAHAETRLGIVGGVNVASLFQTDAHPFAKADYGWVARLDAGLVAEFAGKGRLALRLEPSYVGRGSQYLDPACPCERPVGYVPGHNDLHLSYVDLPVLLVISVGGGRLHPYLLTGAVGSYLAGATAKRNGLREPDPTIYLRRWDAGVAFGGGVRIVTGGIAVTAEARVGLGLVPIDDNSSLHLGVQILAGVTRRVGRH